MEAPMAFSWTDYGFNVDVRQSNYLEMVPNLPFLHALAIGACVTPTDPVLSNTIVKGKFADNNVPKELQKIVIAESGANDGLGYLFLFLALYLIKYIGEGGHGQTGGAAKAVGYWFGRDLGIHDPANCGTWRLYRLVREEDASLGKG